jgi:hypothetical protein
MSKGEDKSDENDTLPEDFTTTREAKDKTIADSFHWRDEICGTVSSKKSKTTPKRHHRRRRVVRHKKRVKKHIKTTKSR